MRETRWLEVDPVQTALAVGGVAITHSLNAVELALRPFTIVRTRGLFGLQSDQQVAAEFQVASLGMCVVSEQAAAIGVTAVPTPETDRSSDLWFMYESISRAFATEAGGGMVADFQYSRYFDSKAMRKVEDGNDIVVVVEADGISDGVVASVSARMLIKLH